MRLPLVNMVNRMMLRKLLLPLVAVGCFSFTAFHLLQSQQTPPANVPISKPATAPYADVVAGAGLIEASTENIKVGSPLPGVVAEVAVSVGSKVARGDVLFHLDDRQLAAELKVREAQLDVAEAALARLEQMPRPEEIPSSEAKVRRAEAQMKSEVDMMERREKLATSGAVPAEEVVQRRHALSAAQEALRQAKAEDELLKAGAWDADKAQVRVEVLRTRSMLEQTRTELERLQVRAPVDGHVMRVDVRRGEYVGTPPGQPLVVLGDLDQLHVRVDIDEQDIVRFRPGMPGTASVRGGGSQAMPIEFVRVEPYVQPKVSLTSSAGERVDTRVLQVIYRLQPGLANVYAGQQVDVFLDASGTKPQALSRR
jgi:HlyD family secretion protein